jgi:hypothetical protein
MSLSRTSLLIALAAVSGAPHAAAQPAARPLTAPIALGWRIESPGTVRVAWRDTTADEDGFELELRTGAGDYVPFARLGGRAGVATAVAELFNGVDTAAALSFRVRATRGGAASPFAYAAAERGDFTAQAPPTTPRGELRLKTRFNFGGVEIGTTKRRSFLLRNASYTESLVVTLQDPPAPFLLVNGADTYVLQPRESRLVPISFSPTEPGKVIKRLRVYSTDPDRELVKVKLIGRGE